jgi:hypothetical protein
LEEAGVDLRVILTGSEAVENDVNIDEHGRVNTTGQYIAQRALPNNFPEVVSLKHERTIEIAHNLENTQLPPNAIEQ